MEYNVSHTMELNGDGGDSDTSQAPTSGMSIKTCLSELQLALNRADLSLASLAKLKALHSTALCR